MKILNSAETASKGEMILYVDEATAAQLEGAVDATRSGLASFDAVIAELGATAVTPVFNMAINTELKREHNMHRWYTVEFSEDIDVEYAAKLLSELKEVERVQFSVPVSTPKVTAVEADPSQFAATRAQELPFNDPGLAQQWHYNNEGLKSIYPESKAGEDINAFAAWNYTAGNYQVIVAVVDEGVKYDHPDLKDNMWVNPGEIAGNGIDDDGNGYVDDVFGEILVHKKHSFRESVIPINFYICLYQNYYLFL